MEKINVAEIFGSNVFNDAVMKERLPKDIYESLQGTVLRGEPLLKEVAACVAAAMKDWAVEKGATHYTHWFQPMTGITAEKHDAFLTPEKDGSVIMDFSAKELIKGESDASSFPSGGLRTTFEARGYTAWDPTSYAFIKDNTLCIPTAFCSYCGLVLDKKTPLLRSMDAVSKQALRVLKFFGSDATRVNAELGPEQEYFLLDKETYEKRLDLIMTGRTLFGAMPPKGQELDDHYYGSIKKRVSDFMRDLDKELWKLGVYAKTEHNEVAPSQHELAPIYTTVNVATDQNQLTMEIMKKVAKKHGLECVLHAKPFEGVSGSGKHNNWSISTDKGEGLLKPGKDPANNIQFLVFFSAVIAAVSKYSDILRVSVATAGNDNRLGGHEAPPAIVSLFLGDMLTEILEDIAEDKKIPDFQKTKLVTGVDVLPVFSKDSTDRNRTSPFAFSGNKFEFRMPGAPQSMADINTVINTIVADVLCDFADRLEKAKDPEKEKLAIIKDTYKEHKNIIFNGNNYTEEWISEAEKRGLPNLKTAPEAIPYFASEKSIALFTRHGVFNEDEIISRCEIMLEDYTKVINIEALTMLDMAQKQILPSCIEYGGMLCDSIIKMRKLGISATVKQEELAHEISSLTEKLIVTTEKLNREYSRVPKNATPKEKADYFCNKILPAMRNLRSVADALEVKVGKDYWPFPTYSELLFNV